MSKQEYTAKNIKTLDIIDAIRRMPGMYVGGGDDSGVEVVLRETIDNSIDEFMNGHGKIISVTIDPETLWMTVTDQGRGIPIEISEDHPTISTLEAVLTKAHTGGKFDLEYGVTGGLHGTGLKAVTALSEAVYATVWRDGNEYILLLVNGVREGEISTTKLPSKSKNQTGTEISFKLNPKYLPDATSLIVPLPVIQRLLKERAYLNTGVIIQLTYGDHQEEFYEENGIAAYITDLADGKLIFPKVFHTQTITDSDIGVEIAIGWSISNIRDNVIGYCNSIRQSEGGTHIQGIKMSIPTIVKKYAQNCDFLQKKDKEISLESSDCFEGVYVIVSIKHKSPVFKGQHKGALSNTDAQGAVMKTVNSALTQWLEENPKESKLVVQRALSAAKARIAASKAKEQVRKQDSGLFGMNNFGKLKDCSSENPEETELFIVEGDSAGGSASQGRDRQTQAIYALKGKPVNSWELDSERVLANNELSDLACAIGTGLFSDDMDEDEVQAVLAKLRYHKIIILADADIDGCMTEDTLVETTEGSITFKELIDSDRLYLGYAKTHTGSEEVVPLFNPHVTKQVSELIEIEFENGSIERVTLDHPFLLNDNKTFISASDLTLDHELSECIED
jgi:DNA gyrase subunit B